MADANRPHCDRCGEVVVLGKYAEWVTLDGDETCTPHLVDCDHCKNDPPYQHTCPACGRGPHAVDPWS